MRKLPLDLSIILTLTLLTLIFVLTPVLSDTFVRTVLGIPMVLFIPGYVLIAALFPKKHDLGVIERITYSFGFSVAISPLLGLLLNFTFRIRLLPLLFALCIYTLAFTFIAAYRRGKLPEEERFSIPFHRIYETINNEFDFNKNRTGSILTGVLIFSIILATGVIYFVLAAPKVGERLTEFYILGPDGKAENYSTDLKYNSPSEILVGVVNHEYTSVNYTVQVALDREILTDAWFRLDHNQTWEKNLTYVPDKTGTYMKLEFLLFKEDNFTAPYRDLHLWVNVTK